MRLLAAIIADPAAGSVPGFATTLEGLLIDTLVLQRTATPLDKDVVHPPLPAIHEDLHAGVLEGLRESEAG